MSSGIREKTFSSKEHRDRLGAALGRRLYPNTNLHPKQLAHALNVSTWTIQNWANGENDPASFVIGELMAFFADRGDFSFWSEVYGPIGEQMRRRFVERQAEQAKQAEQERRHLQLLTGTQE